MSISTIILDAGSKGAAQVNPNSYPTTIQLSFEPQGNATLLYGVDGQQPSIKVSPGTTPIVINSNSLQLNYSVSSLQAKIQWEL